MIFKAHLFISADRCSTSKIQSPGEAAHVSNSHTKKKTQFFSGSVVRKDQP